MSKDAELALRAGLAALQLSLSDAQFQELLDYQTLIGKWTKVYNLTSVRDPAEMLTHHLLDSLAAVAPLQKHLQGRGLSAPSLLDVGSGAGLPGVLSSARILDKVVPDADVVLAARARAPA